MPRTNAAVPVEVWLAQTIAQERIALLPAKLRHSLEALVEAACDMFDEAYTLPFDSHQGEAKVQTSGATGIVRGVKNSGFAFHLTHRAPAQLDELRTEMRKMQAGHAPRSAPRFRGAPKNAG